MTNIQYYKGAIDATGCISNAWNLVSVNYGLYLGICALTLAWERTGDREFLFTFRQILYRAGRHL